MNEKEIKSNHSSFFVTGGGCMWYTSIRCSMVCKRTPKRHLAG